MDYFLEALRAELRISGVPKRLALAAGLSESYLSQIKRGKKDNPSREVVASICEALGVTYTEMVNRGRRLFGTSTAPTDTDERKRSVECLHHIFNHGTDEQIDFVQSFLERECKSIGGFGPNIPPDPDAASSGMSGRSAPLRRGRKKKAI